MKLHPKWIATAVTGIAALAAVQSAHAQGASGTATLGSMTAGNTTLYAGWSAGGATITTSAAGYEVASSGYGSLYYANPTPIALNSADTEVTLNFTLNAPAGPFNIGVPFILNDNDTQPPGAQTYSTYAVFGAGAHSVSFPLQAAQQTAVNTGSDVLYGFNLEFDPAGSFSSGYDITFNSLTLSAVPEPSTYALMAMGAASFAAFYRRKK